MLIQYGFILLWAAALFILAVAAALRGGWAERAGVSLASAAWLLSLVVVQLSQQWAGPHAGLFAVDALLLLGLSVVGFSSAKIWPLVASGFQLCGLCLHIACWVQPGRWNGAYFVGLQLTSAAVLAAIAAGVFGAWRRDDGGRAAPGDTLSQVHL